MAVVVTFEHHLNHDLSGYPSTELKEKVSLFGSIVAIADRYDALTTARVYRDYNYTPHEALSYLISNAGTLFDPILVKLFVEIMGLYPPGTLVELNTGDLAVVCAAPALGTPLDRPTVRVVDGAQVGSTLDLSREAGEGPLPSITRVMNPANKGQMPAIEPSMFEVAD
jgi:HD-GYP domain-containing protein (c-di-GMP phosphodiesterase class II)